MNSETSSGRTSGKGPIAVVLGACVHSLAMIRSLAREGVEVYALEAQQSLPGCRTRHARVIQVPDINGRGLVSALLDLAARERFESPPILFPINDNMVRVIGEHWPQLGAYYRISWSDCIPDILRLQKKHEVEQQCRRNGLPHPESHVIHSLEDVPADAQFPMLIKPDRPLSGFKALKIEDREELLQSLQEHREDFPIIAQQWIEGDARRLVFCAVYFVDGQVHSWFTGGKIDSWPPLLGQATVVESIEDDRLLELTRQFFAGLEITGPVALEFKIDDEGRYWVIEPNVGRTEYLVDLCIAAGVNFPLIEYRQQLGEEPGPMATTRPTVWYDSEREMVAYFKNVWRTGSLRPYDKQPVFAYFGHSDNRPALAALRVAATKVLRSVAGKLGRILPGAEADATAPGSEQCEVYSSYNELPSQARELLASVGEGQCFTSDFWFSNFEHHVLSSQERVRYVVMSVGGEVKLVLPLMLEKYGRIKLNSLTSISNFYTAMYHPVVCPEDMRDPAQLQAHMDSLFRYIHRRFRHVPRIVLQPMDPQHRVFEATSRALQQLGYELDDFYCFGNWYQDTTGLSYDEYMAQRPSFLRNIIKRKGRKLEREHDMDIRLVSSLEELFPALDDFEAIYRASWKPSEPSERFIRKIAIEMFLRDRLRLGLLYVDGQPAACQMWFRDEDRMSVFKLSYHPDFKNYSVGSILSAWLMRHFIEVDGVCSVDMQTGDDRYKRDWVKGVRERRGIEAINAGNTLGKLLLMKRRHFPDRLESARA